jgi:hypothetical protein
MQKQKLETLISAPKTSNPRSIYLGMATRWEEMRAMAARPPHLESIDGEEAAEDALLETRSQHDHVVLHVHCVHKPICSAPVEGSRGCERGVV